MFGYKGFTYACIVGTIIFIICGAYIGFAFGMEAWAQSLTDLYIDSAKIDPYGNEYPNCTNMEYINATYNLYVKYDCYKVDKTTKLSCSDNCDDYGGYDTVDYKLDNDYIRDKIYHTCFIISILVNDTIKNVYLNDCYNGMNVTEIMSVIPANADAGWVITYVLITLPTIIAVIVLIFVWCSNVYEFVEDYNDVNSERNAVKYREDSATRRNSALNKHEEKLQKQQNKLNEYEIKLQEREAKLRESECIYEQRGEELCDRDLKLRDRERDCDLKQRDRERELNLRERELNLRERECDLEQRRIYLSGRPNTDLSVTATDKSECGIYVEELSNK